MYFQEQIVYKGQRGPPLESPHCTERAKDLPHEINFKFNGTESPQYSIQYIICVNSTSATEGP